MDNRSLLVRYLKLANEYIFAAKLLLDGFDRENIDPMGHFYTKPLFHLIGHACECLLKAVYIEKHACDEKDLKEFKHDLIALMKEMDADLSDELKELIYYIANNHFNFDGVKGSHPLRYDDSNFDSQEEQKRFKALLKKQKENGYSSEKPIYIGQATEEQKNKLDPELSDYSDYLFSHTLMIPKPKFAIETIRKEIEGLINKIGSDEEILRIKLTREEFLDKMTVEVTEIGMV